MKKSDIYEVAIKILGLYMIVVVIEQIRNILILIPVLFQKSQPPEGYNQMGTFWMMGVGLILFIFFTWLFLFRNKSITRLITQPTDKEERVALPITRKNIFEISLVLLGLILFVWTLPDFLLKFKGYITSVQHDIPIKNYEKTFLLSSSLKIILAVLAIAYSAPISHLLSRKEKVK